MKENGYRLNVGLIIANKEGKLLKEYKPNE